MQNDERKNHQNFIWIFVQNDELPGFGSSGLSYQIALKIPGGQKLSEISGQVLRVGPSFHISKSRNFTSVSVINFQPYYIISKSNK